MASASLYPNDYQQPNVNNDPLNTDPYANGGGVKITDPAMAAAGGTNPIPTNPNGSQVGSGTPWATGASAPSAAPPGYTWNDKTASYASTPGTAATGSPESMIDALYQQYGIGDGGRGSGFADRAYWLEHPSEILNGRLGADLAGTGTDQPTGTPGSGPWTNSGRGGGGQQTPVGSPNPQGLLQGSADYSGLQGIMQQQLAMQQQQMQQQQAMRDQFRQSILSQLGTLENDKTATDPNGSQLAPIIGAYHLQSQRGLDRTRNAIAEANYANGTLNSGGFQSQEQGALENAGAQEANFTGQQVSQAVSQRQQQLQHLLDVGAGFLSQGDQQSIQTELAQLQAQMQQQQLGYNYAALGQQNNQFNNSLGYNYTALQSQMNQQALMQAMGY